eukprot:Clim_evm16s162 gene=Clim_evmTU16s162
MMRFAQWSMIGAALWTGSIWAAAPDGSACGTFIELRQEDFDQGTYRILTPNGCYRLEEDITFRPNINPEDAYNSGWLTPEQFASNGGAYPDDAYGIGFFAAITVETDNTYIDLNGKTIEQGADHALLQRFFAIVELATAPFIPGQGPFTFTDDASTWKPATDVTIRNGVFGRSAHHGIHGNNNNGVLIEDVDFHGYELAAVGLNGANNVVIRNCQGANRKDVPVLGTFSSVRFMQRFVDSMVAGGSSTTLIVQGDELTAKDIQESIQRAVQDVFDDVMSTGFISKRKADIFNVFTNPWKVIDGNSYGFLVNKVGVAVLGEPKVPEDTATMGTNILLENLTVKDQESVIIETPTVRTPSGAILRDAVGAVVQLLKEKKTKSEDPLTISSWKDEDAEYIGDIAANTQMLVGKAIVMGDPTVASLDGARSSITQEVINWVEATPGTSESKLAFLLNAQSGYQCNGDDQNHVAKGAIGLAVFGSRDVTVREVAVSGVKNYGKAGSTCCGNYMFSHAAATIPGYHGNSSRGVVVAGSTNIELIDVEVEKVESYTGTAVGFDVTTDSSEVSITRCSANMNRARNYPGLAIGFQFGEEVTDGVIEDWCSMRNKAKHMAAYDYIDASGTNSIGSEVCRRRS